MSWFEATTHSDGVVSADRATVWEVLTDPETVAALTPLVERIVPDGEHWRWHFTPVPLVGQRFTPCFTERMEFQPMERIDYRHDPPPEAPERAGANGWYTLTETDAGTHLAIGLTISVQLPLPAAAGPAVRSGMRAVMARTGAGFEQRFTRRLEQLSA